MCASSCWKRRTRVSPVSAPLNSLRCSTPKSASLMGSSRYERVRCANMRQCPAAARWGAGVSVQNLLRYQRCRLQKRAAHFSSVASVVPGRHLSMIIMWHLRARSSRSRRGMGLRRQGCLACARRHAHSPTVTAAARQPTGPPARAAEGGVRVGGRGPRRGSSWA